MILKVKSILSHNLQHDLIPAPLALLPVVLLGPCARCDLKSSFSLSCVHMVNVLTGKHLSDSQLHETLQVTLAGEVCEHLREGWPGPPYISDSCILRQDTAPFSQKML